MVSGFTNSRYPTTSRGPHFNQFEQQEQDADEQKKTAEAAWLAILVQQFENLKAADYVAQEKIEKELKSLKESQAECRKDFEDLKKSQQETRKDFEDLKKSQEETHKGFKRIDEIASRVEILSARVDKNSDEISKGNLEMKSQEALLDPRLQKIKNNLLLCSKEQNEKFEEIAILEKSTIQDLPEEINEEKKNADEFLGDESEANDLPIQNPEGDHLKVASLEMQELVVTPKVNDESQDEATVIKNHENDPIEDVDFENKSPKKPKEVIEQLPTKKITDFILNDIEEKKEEMSDLLKNAQQQNQIIEEPPKLSVFPELFPSEAHIEEIGNPQSNISNNLKDATLLISAYSITQPALPNSVRQTPISNKEIKLSPSSPSTSTPSISKTQKQTNPTYNEKINSTDLLKIKNQKTIPQKEVKNLNKKQQNICLLFFKMISNIFYYGPLALVQYFWKKIRT